MKHYETTQLAKVLCSTKRIKHRQKEHFTIKSTKKHKTQLKTSLTAINKCNDSHFVEGQGKEMCLKKRFKNRQLALVLENCEHLIPSDF